MTYDLECVIFSIEDVILRSEEDSIRGCVRASVWSSVVGSAANSAHDTMGASIKDTVIDSVRMSLWGSIRGYIDEI